MAPLNVRHAAVDVKLARNARLPRPEEVGFAVPAVEVESGIVEEVRLRHGKDAHPRHRRRERQDHDLRMPGRDACDGTDLRRLFEARLEVSHDRTTQLRPLRKRDTRVLGKNRDLALVLRLEPPGDAVVARMEHDRPFAEVDPRHVGGEIDGRLLVDRRRNRALDVPDGRPGARAASVHRSVFARHERNLRRLDERFPVAQNGVRHLSATDLKPQLVAPVGRHGAEQRRPGLRSLRKRL